jgi:hypothetical protein
MTDPAGSGLEPALAGEGLKTDGLTDRLDEIEARLAAAQASGAWSEFDRECISDIAWLLSELRSARAENAVLRGIAGKIMPCHYCGAGDIAKCPHGFPGCALADDMWAAQMAAPGRLDLPGAVM